MATDPSAVQPVPDLQAGPMTKEQLEKCLRTIIGGPDADIALRRILGWVGQYAAHMIELYARPDDRWGPK